MFILSPRLLLIYATTPLAILQWDITSRPLESDVILCGDYNAHTNVAVDFVIDELEGSNGDLDSLIPNDSKESLEIIFDMYSKKQLGRYSADKKPLNSHGINLIDLCKSLGLLIVNGRLGDDKGIGGFTRIDTTGSSVVDYVITNPRLFPLITSFAINSKMSESDHLAISFSLGCVPQITMSRENNDINLKYWQPQKKFHWRESDLTPIRNALTDDEGQASLYAIHDALVELQGTNQVALAINKYISQAITRVCRPCIPKANKKANIGPQWFDKQRFLTPGHQGGNKQRVLMHRHQGWNVRHGLCHIYMRYIYIYIYIWVVYSFCLFCCLFIIVTWWYIWCIVWQVASKRKYRHVW